MHQYFHRFHTILLRFKLVNRNVAATLKGCDPVPLIYLIFSRTHKEGRTVGNIFPFELCVRTQTFVESSGMDLKEVLLTILSFLASTLIVVVFIAVGE